MDKFWAPRTSILRKFFDLIFVGEEKLLRINEKLSRITQNFREIFGIYTIHILVVYRYNIFNLFSFFKFQINIIIFVLNHDCLLKLYVWFHNPNITCHKTNTLSLNLYKNTFTNVRFLNYLFNINTKRQHCSFEQQLFVTITIHVVLLRSEKKFKRKVNARNFFIVIRFISWVCWKV